MDEHSIERIRKAEFSLTVRGYDRNEVDRFLAELADWLETGGGEQAAGVEAVQRELERVGEQTAEILTEAHAAAQSIRDDASAQVRQQLVDANLTAESLRSEATEYAADTRDEADAYARKVRSEADTYAERSRGELEKLISDLERRRDAVLAELERLASGLAGTATEYRPRAEAEEPADDPEATEETVLAHDAT